MFSVYAFIQVKSSTDMHYVGALLLLLEEITTAIKKLPCDIHTNVKFYYAIKIREAYIFICSLAAASFPKNIISGLVFSMN